LKNHSEHGTQKSRAAPTHPAHVSDAPLPSLQLSEFSFHFKKSNFAPDIFGALLE
jgi:hypothetical protein